MAIDSQQFRILVVQPTLLYLDPEIPNSQVAEELLMFTVAHESNMGGYLKQLGGPALSVFMIERPTFDWLTKNVLSRPPDSANWPLIRSKISMLTVRGKHDETIHNLQYATAIARLRYFVAKEPLPTTITPGNLASYWAKHYQTTNDPRKISQAIFDYTRYVH